MNVAVVFNEHSHLSVEHLAALGRRIQKLFTGASFVTCRGFGHTYIEDSSVLEVGRVLDYKQRITMMVQTLLQKKPDYVVSVGGDGLASYIASTIAKKAEHVVMLGIAAGTANVGPIVSFSLDELNSLTFADLEVVSIDGIEVVDETGYLGLGFNDVILGNSFLGTEHGTCCNLSVESLLIHGERVPVKVGERITTERFTVVIDGHPKQLFSQLPIAQIVVTPLQFDKLYGRAIFGGLCLGHDISPLAAIGFSTRNVVDCTPGVWETTDCTAVQHLVFSSSSEVVLTNLGEDAHIVIDGNPFLRNGEVHFQLKPGVIHALKRKPEREYI